MVILDVDMPNAQMPGYHFTQVPTKKVKSNAIMLNLNSLSTRKRTVFKTVRTKNPNKQMAN